MKVTVTKPDEFDLAELLDMVESRPYQLIRARLATMHEQEIRALVNAPTWDEAHGHQEAIKMLEAVSNLPKIVEAEIRGKKK